MAVVGIHNIASLMRKSSFHILRPSLSCLEHASIMATTFWRDEGSAVSLELWARIEIGKLNASKQKGRGFELLECVKGRGKTYKEARREEELCSASGYG
jgi:hypothetical protein